jgi:hypothetical protein
LRSPRADWKSKALSLSSFDIGTIVAAALVILAFAYAAFWAFNIRRNLQVELYRHQALGIGLVAVCVGYFTYVLDNGINYLPVAASEYPLDDIFFYSFLACLVPLLYWTDSSLLAARNSDPLLRDVLHWGRIRNVLWGAVVICLGAGGAYVVYQSVFLSQQAAQAGNSTYLVGVPFILNLTAVVVPLGVPLAVGPVFLSVAVRRTKDLTLRRHMKWFGLGAAFLVSGALASELLIALLGNSLLLPISLLVLFSSSAYCFYRSARAVLPIYSFTEGAS